MSNQELDVIVVGAGFAGLYALHRLRGQGRDVWVLEAAPALGGTWYWNAYPGARCDVESMEYSYSFSPELDQEWTWTERFASQPEILRYINHVADRFDLRRDVQLNTRVTAAMFDDRDSRWIIESHTGERFTAQFLVLATGCLSAPLTPPFDGVDSFGGESYMTQTWPQAGVDFAGKRVAAIGTGSSGVQAIPVIAETARQIVVFQRTPNFSVPGRNRRLADAEVAAFKAGYPEHRERQRWSRGGIVRDVNYRKAAEMTTEELLAELEKRWADGGALGFSVAYRDMMTDVDANKIAQEFIRAKISEKVDNPQLAALLCPTDHPYCAKRPCVDHGYFETYNRDNVTLIDVRHNAIRDITRAGVRLDDGTVHDVDVIVYALGYDAVSGSITRIDIRGRQGAALRDEWSNGPASYLGLAVAKFPNMFSLNGPGSPSVLAHLILLAEQQVDWIADCITHMRQNQIDAIEATADAQREWTDRIAELAAGTLYPLAPKSYYMGGNVPGKPPVFPVYLGGLARYRQRCNDVATAEYTGFRLDNS